MMKLIMECEVGSSCAFVKSKVERDDVEAEGWNGSFPD